MTEVQRFRLQGFKASLAVRGVTLTVGTGPGTVRVLVERTPADGGDRMLARETAAGDRIHVLRDAFRTSGIGVGTTLRDAENQFTYRVTEVVDAPANVAVVLAAETAPIEDP